MNVLFERAADADAEALVAVQIAAFHSNAPIFGIELSGPPGYDSPGHARSLMQQHSYYKIVADGQIIGGIVVCDQGEGHFLLDLLYIDPRFHKLGIGTRAMQFIEQTFPAKKWSLDTPAWAIRNQHFYEKRGYVKVSEEKFPGITMFAYEKHIGG
jgi:GNAT superfamily N-acetyltransferase